MDYLKIANEVFSNEINGIKQVQTQLGPDFNQAVDLILNSKGRFESKEIQKLSKLGLKVRSYNEKELKKLGLNALLGVGQGSANETYLVTIEWSGKKNSLKNTA